MDATAVSESVGSSQAAPGLARAFADTLREFGGDARVDIGEIMRSLAWLRPESS